MCGSSLSQYILSTLVPHLSTPTSWAGHISLQKMYVSNPPLNSSNFNLTLRNLLYGDDNLSDEFNVFAYLSIQYNYYERNLVFPLTGMKDWDNIAFDQWLYIYYLSTTMIYISLRLFVNLFNFIYIYTVLLMIIRELRFG